MSLITIGIPAYNRPAELERAVRSALAQDHPDLEVLVSDDASPDPAIPALLSRVAGADPRLRVLRQERNLGHAGNYQAVLEAARGDYFMWLADDDWIEPEYVSRCVGALEADPEAVLVCGQGRYYARGRHVIDERPIDLVSPRPAVRVARYFARVSVNGPLFGLARRADLLARGFPQTIGGDWLLVAALAGQGRVRTLEDVHIHRSLEGLGSDSRELAESFGLTGAAARQHHVALAFGMARQVAFGTWAPAGVAWPARALLALTVTTLIIARFSLVEVARGVLGPRLASALETRLATWLRKREQR